MIILDLEWNQGYDKTVLDEVLQIGAVRVDRLGGPITDTFCAFIRPRVHKKMKQMARYLPELRRSLDSETTFPEAMGAFLDWCGRRAGIWRLGQRRYGGAGPELPVLEDGGRPVKKGVGPPARVLHHCGHRPERGSVPGRWNTAAFQRPLNFTTRERLRLYGGGQPVDLPGGYRRAVVARLGKKIYLDL